MANQRIASALSHQADTTGFVPGIGYEEGNMSLSTDAIIVDIEASLDCLYGEDVDLDWEQMLAPMSLGEFSFVDCVNQVETTDPTQLSSDACACEQSTYWSEVGFVYCFDMPVIYYYHPDYLGSVEFITDMRGDPYQFFLNTIWGENLQNQRAYDYKSFSSRFRFNGKEWDEETGNFYYGARYYDPQISVWLSVDPLASESPSLTPYHFVSNNPVMRIDPDGLHDWGLNQDGEMVHLRDTKDDFDRLIVLDKDGNETDQTLKVKQCTFGNNYEEGNSYGVIINNNEQDADKIYKFMADQFDGADGRKEIEVGMVTGTKDGVTTSVIHTAGSSEYTETGQVALYLKKKGYTVQTTNHSHPGGNEYSMPSGVYTDGSIVTPRKGDIKSADWINTNINKGVKNYMYHPQSGKTWQYDKDRIWKK